MSDWLTLIVLVLAAFRLTRLVTTDVITEPLRRRIWARWPAEDTLFPDDGTVDIDPDNVAMGETQAGVEVFWSDGDRAWLPLNPTLVGYLVGCDFCASVYVSGLVALAASLALGWGVWLGLAVWWGLAGAVSVLAVKA